MANTITIKATVSRVVYPRESECVESSKPQFTVILTNYGKCVGMLSFRPAEGSSLNLTGSYEAWHGERNFRFVRATQDIPQDPKALLQYVCRIGRGLGDKTAEKVWNQYGADWRSHVEEFSPAMSQSFVRTLNALGANKAKTDLSVFCLKIGCGPAVAEKAWDAWRESAMATINANPYSIASLPGCGFKTADAVGEHFGIGKSDIRRALAAIDYSVSNAMESSGDSIVSRDAVYDAIRDLGVDRSVASAAMAKLVSSGRIVFPTMDTVTTSRVVKEEGDFARYIVTHRTLSTDIPKLEWPNGFKPDKCQVEAVENAMSHMGLTIINGGAGTGKTTIIRTLARTLESIGCSVELCAFAGKAAARLREATGHSASTIHSMLGWMGESFRQGNLHGVTVIVDEASMVPSSLLYEITKRDPERLILVGDQAQLQPVGVGSPFHDAIDAMKSVVTTLDTFHRNKEAVFSSANMIRNGIVPQSEETGAEKFEVRRFRGPDQIHEWIEARVRSGEVDFDQDIILSPRNGEGEEPAPCTVKSINSTVQDIVNPHERGVAFKVGDRVMCTKNFPVLDIWNGTCGTITRIDIDGVPYMLPDDSDSEVKLSSKETRGAIVQAYCLTVHKSQGSQYRDVYVCVLRRDAAVLLDNSMLYTAVTRARRACHILCDDRIDRVVGTISRRTTYLRKLLKAEL